MNLQKDKPFLMGSPLKEWVWTGEVIIKTNTKPRFLLRSKDGEVKWSTLSNTIIEQVDNIPTTAPGENWQPYRKTY